MTPEPRSLCGVRFDRRAPVRFVDPGGHALEIGQIVVIERVAVEPPLPLPAAGPSPATARRGRVRAALRLSLATVVLRPDQVIEREIDPHASGRVLRIATEEDVVAFGRRAAAALQAVAQTNALLAEKEADARATDAWLSPDGARLWIALDRPLGDARLRARDLARQFGRDIELWLQDRPLTGVRAARFSFEDSGWLALPDDPPTVRLALRSERDSNAGAFIERQFPAEERPTRRRL